MALLRVRVRAKVRLRVGVRDRVEADRRCDARGDGLAVSAQLARRVEPRRAPLDEGGALLAGDVAEIWAR